ncbi:alpha-hydroxy-acid oxidizing protein [Mesorhizobium sp. BR1-1-3]|nr:alpha-hydroxy-acid oxidizing protein [Mesorhizobium sp. BR1-1-3]
MAAARGAGVAEAVFTTAAIEDGVAVSQSPVWFLLYRQSNRGFNGTALGQAICVAVDMPKPGDRRRQFRAGFKIPDGLATPYFKDRNTGVLKVGTAQRRPCRPGRILPGCVR